MRTYSIVIADDHTAIRKGLVNLVSELPGVEVIAEASDGLELLDIIKTKQPDMAIVDISMPNLGGLQAAREIIDHYPETKVIMLTMHRHPEYLKHALSIGVHGYLLKDKSGPELHAAIMAVRNGEQYITQFSN